MPQLTLYNYKIFPFFFNSYPATHFIQLQNFPFFLQLISGILSPYTITTIPAHSYNPTALTENNLIHFVCVCPRRNCDLKQTLVLRLIQTFKRHNFQGVLDNLGVKITNIYR
jgi:hypothetical protein